MLINYFQSWNKQQSHVMIEYKLSKEGTKHKWQYSRVSLYLYQRQWQILYLFITIRDAAEKKCMYKASKYHLPLSLTFNLQQSKKKLLVSLSYVAMFVPQLPFLVHKHSFLVFQLLFQFIQISHHTINIIRFKWTTIADILQCETTQVLTPCTWIYFHKLCFLCIMYHSSVEC